MPDIELTNLHHNHDLEKSSTSIEIPNSNTESAYPPIYPLPKPLQRKLISYIIIEALISLIIYYNYFKIEISTHHLIAPTILGASTAALAQSINQYSKRNFSLNRIFKFVVWGCINGCFTVLWIDMLIYQVDGLTYRIVVDQFIGAPTFQLIFSILNCLWDYGELNYTLKNSYLKSLKFSYCYWPFFSICSFMFIPQSMIFPANCLANLIWNLILSKLT